MRRSFVVVSLLSVLAFGVRALLWFRHAPTELDFVEVTQAAMCFAKNGFIGNPFVIPTGPTAHVTPVFPVLTGLMYRWAGDLHRGLTWASLLTIAIASLQFALLPVLAVAVGFRRIVGIVAGLIGAIVPALYLDCSADFEAPLIGLAVVIASIVALRCRSPFLSGLFWGLMAMVSAQLLMVGTLYETGIRANQTRWRQLPILFAGLILGVMPWTVRNSVELSHPVVSRDNAGLELAVSNNDVAAVTFDENLKRHVLLTIHPHSSVAEAQKVRDMGEVNYNAMRKQQAVAWIKAHPGRFIDLSWRRFFAFWLYSNAGTVMRVYWIAILVLGLGGIFVARKQARITFFFTLLAIYPLPHYIVQASDRYRYPLNVVLLLFTGVLLVQLFRPSKAASIS